MNYLYKLKKLIEAFRKRKQKKKNKKKNKEQKQKQKQKTKPQRCFLEVSFFDMI